jgi:hypothetical protein
MSFKDGIFTLRDNPSMFLSQGGMGQYNEAARAVLQAPPGLPASGRRVGLECSSRDQCWTGACVSRVCSTCRDAKDCGAGEVCTSDETCVSKEALERQRQANAEWDANHKNDNKPQSGGPAPKPKPKGIGEKCDWNEDCQSKHCGTLSSGQHHKCVSKP